MGIRNRRLRHRLGAFVPDAITVGKFLRNRERPIIFHFSFVIEDGYSKPQSLMANEKFQMENELSSVYDLPLTIYYSCHEL
jgi:hypothetical protein